MTKKCLTIVMLVILLSWVAAAQDARTVIANATKALGADNLKTIEYSGSGADFSLGQAMNPSAPWPRFNDKTYNRVIDFDAWASRMQRVRTQGENPPRGGGGQPVFGEQPQTQVVVNPQQLQNELMMMLPYGFLKVAAMSNPTVKSQKMGGKTYSVVSFTGSNKAIVSGYINDQGMIDKLETKIDNAVLGDTPFETTFTDYKDFGGLKFPTHIVQKQGGYAVFDLTVTDAKANVAANIQNPQAKGKGGAGGPPAPAAVETEKLSDGVYLILGGYAAVAVDMKDGIYVIEGPQSEQRALAIIGEAKKLIPNKQIKYVINTHAHFDHASGLRTFVAEGATIITHQVNKGYYEKVLSNPATLNPGKLEEAKKKVKVEYMTEKKVLTDGNHVIELHHVKGSLHNDGMILAYLPKEKVIIEADEFNPPAPNQPVANISPYWTNLYDNLVRLKLDYDRIIPIHYPNDNRKVMKAELTRAIGKGN
jgi:glyoxylase-like metal-dependent hydrolase (beta-lactamase superfamily II)